MNPRRPSHFLAALVALCVAFGIVAGVACAEDGALDPSFGVGGQVTSDPTPLNEDLTDAVLDDQGRIVVAFAGGPNGSGTPRAFVARYLPDAEIDRSFGAGGVAEIPWTGEGETAEPVGVAIDDEGRIVVGGRANKGSARRLDFAAARFFSNGVLDPGFGEAGITTLDIPGGGFDVAGDVAVDPRGQVLVAGTAIKTGPQSTSSMTVVRWTEAGALDPSFGTNGVAKVNRTGSPTGSAAPVSTDAATIAIDVAGRIVVGGSASTDTDERSTPIVARLDEDGDLDAGFGVGGVAQVTLSPGSSGGIESLVTSGEEIVVAGGFTIGGTQAFGVGRLLASGEADPAFSEDGAVVISQEGAELAVGAVAVDPVGRVIVAGRVREPLITSAVLFRFTPAGAPDPAFGGAGVVRANFSTAFAIGGRPLVDGAGRYLLVGIGSSGTVRVLGFARFLNSSLSPAVATPESAPPSPAPPPAPAPSPAPPPAPVPKCGGRAATIVGTAAADKLKGTKRADVIVGLGGNDTIKGLGGNDLVCAGAGADKVFGGAGDDRSLGEGGNDQLFGGPGADALLGGAGADTLVGGPGKDHQVGRPGKDTQH